MNDILREVEDDYNNCKEQFENLQNKAIETSSSIRQVADEIQGEEHAHRVGRLFYSSTGIIGGGLGIAGIALAPVTLGLSLGLSIAGAAVGLSSGAANIIHTNVKESRIKSKIQTAHQSLESFKTTWEEFTQNLDNLRVRLTEYREAMNRFAVQNDSSLEVLFLQTGAGAVEFGHKIHKLVKLSTALHLLNTGVADDIAAAVLKNGVRISAKVLIPISAGFILWEIGNIIQKSSEIPYQTLHKKAEELLKIAKDLDTAMEDIIERLYEVFPRD